MILLHSYTSLKRMKITHSKEQIRQQCWAREDYYRAMRAYNKDIADLKSEISKKDQQLMEKDGNTAF